MCIYIYIYDICISTTLGKHVSAPGVARRNASLQNLGRMLELEEPVEVLSPGAKFKHHKISYIIIVFNSG